MLPKYECVCVYYMKMRRNLHRKGSRNFIPSVSRLSHLTYWLIYSPRRETWSCLKLNRPYFSRCWHLIFNQPMSSLANQKKKIHHFLKLWCSLNNEYEKGEMRKCEFSSHCQGFDHRTHTSPFVVFRLPQVSKSSSEKLEKYRDFSVLIKTWLEGIRFAANYHLIHRWKIEIR